MNQSLDGGDERRDGRKRRERRTTVAGLGVGVMQLDVIVPVVVLSWRVPG
jgi:hypothetical protein